MGYYTRYSLHVRPRSAEPEIRARLTALSGYTVAGPFVEEWTSGRSVNDGEGCKWYEYREHCTQVSAEFPHVLIVLTGIGEEDHDVWCRAWRGGQECT